MRERLLAQPPDHILIVEQEQGLREIIQTEVQSKIDWPVEGCSLEQFVNEAGLAIGAQVFAPNHLMEGLKPFIPLERPAVSITYSNADEHMEVIRKLKKPSIIAVASGSESLLKAARSLFAAAIGRKHVLQEILLPPNKKMKLEGVDLAFCDSLAMTLVSCRHKVHYQLVPPDCLDYLAVSVAPSL